MHGAMPLSNCIVGARLLPDAVGHRSERIVPPLKLESAYRLIALSEQPAFPSSVVESLTRISGMRPPQVAGSDRAELVARLREIRARAVDSGLQLWSADEILEEVRRRRGEPSE